MGSFPFPNGQTLNTSALSPPIMATLFQNLTAMILGFDIPAPPKLPQAAYKAVRVAYQQTGQPFNTPDQDICYIMAYPENEAFTEVTDAQLSQNNSSSLLQTRCYTQVWRIHWIFYGPNAFEHASLVVSAMELDWVHDYLQNPPPPVNTQIYAITKWSRPRYVPELRVGQWWQRCDVDLKFNERVLQTITIPSAASATVEIITDVGLTDTVTLEA